MKMRIEVEIDIDDTKLSSNEKHNKEYINEQIKFAKQRAQRGWDDNSHYSVPSWLGTIMPEILREIKQKKIGFPISFLPQYCDNITEEIRKECKEKWNKELDKIIAGFEAGFEVDQYLLRQNTEEYKTSLEGMELFVKYYFNLWD